MRQIAALALLPAVAWADASAPGAWQDACAARMQLVRSELVKHEPWFDASTVARKRNGVSFELNLQPLPTGVVAYRCDACASVIEEEPGDHAPIYQQRKGGLRIEKRKGNRVGRLSLDVPPGAKTRLSPGELTELYRRWMKAAVDVCLELKS